MRLWRRLIEKDQIQDCVAEGRRVAEPCGWTSGAGCVRGCEGGLILARGETWSDCECRRSASEAMHGDGTKHSRVGARPKRQWAGVVQDWVGGCRRFYEARRR